MNRPDTERLRNTLNFGMRASFTFGEIESLLDYIDYLEEKSLTEEDIQDWINERMKESMEFIASGRYSDKYDAPVPFTVDSKLLNQAKLDASLGGIAAYANHTLAGVAWQSSSTDTIWLVTCINRTDMLVTFIDSTQENEWIIDVGEDVTLFELYQTYKENFLVHRYGAPEREDPMPCDGEHEWETIALFTSEYQRCKHCKKEKV